MTNKVINIFAASLLMSAVPFSMVHAEQPEHVLTPRTNGKPDFSVEMIDPTNLKMRVSIVDNHYKDDYEKHDDFWLGYITMIDDYTTTFPVTGFNIPEYRWTKNVYDYNEETPIEEVPHRKTWEVALIDDLSENTTNKLYVGVTFRGTKVWNQWVDYSGCVNDWGPGKLCVATAWDGTDEDPESYTAMTQAEYSEWLKTYKDPRLPEEISADGDENDKPNNSADTDPDGNDSAGESSPELNNDSSKDDTEKDPATANPTNDNDYSTSEENNNGGKNESSNDSGSASDGSHSNAGGADHADNNTDSSQKHTTASGVDAGGSDHRDDVVDKNGSNESGGGANDKQAEKQTEAKETAQVTAILAGAVKNSDQKAASEMNAGDADHDEVPDVTVEVTRADNVSKEAVSENAVTHNENASETTTNDEPIDGTNADDESEAAENDKDEETGEETGEEPNSVDMSDDSEDYGKIPIPELGTTDCKNCVIWPWILLGAAFGALVTTVLFIIIRKKAEKVSDSTGEE